MSVLRAEKILDYLASPLSRCLRDESPYVRKTAALCVAKVFDLKPELCIEYGFIETLRDLIGDGNPMVSNVTAREIWRERYCRESTTMRRDPDSYSCLASCRFCLEYHAILRLTRSRHQHITASGWVEFQASSHDFLIRCRCRCRCWLVVDLNLRPCQVVANAVTALADIHEAAQSLSETANGSGSANVNGETEEPSASPPSSARPDSQLFIIDQATLAKLLVALNECSEWGRIAILSTLARYKASDSEESEHICERVMPQFQHNNAAVVLGAVKVSRVGMVEQGQGLRGCGWLDECSASLRIGALVGKNALAWRVDWLIQEPTRYLCLCLLRRSS
jgi:hypothetical protein